MSARLDLSHCQELASARGGRCLSDSYAGAHGKLDWECSSGHSWSAKPNDVQQGHWCRQCGNSRKDVSWCREMAAARGGRCLADSYVNNRQKLQWSCHQGHTWLARPCSVQAGDWCLKCSGRARKDISWCREMAAQRGGSCLSAEYVNSKTRVQWRCAQGHVWHSKPASVSRGQWCRQCATEKGRVYKDPLCRKLATRLRVRLCNAVRRVSRAGSAVRDLGASIPEFRTYMESRFQPGMSWDNWGKGPGKWEIDHVMPLARFDLSKREDVLAACHYTNLQPLWGAENASKGASLPASSNNL